MKIYFKIIGRIISALLFVCIIFIATEVLWLKTGHITPAKEFFLRKFPVPIAFVGSGPVWPGEFFSRTLSLSAIKPKELGPDEYMQIIFDRLLEEKRLDKLLAGKNGGYFKPPASEFAGKLLEDWQAKQTALKIWYFGQPDLNSEIYLKAGGIEKLLGEDKSFESLAREYSSDAVSKTYFGDLGYLEAKDILPEILRAADTMSAGETKKVAGRQGLHIIKLEGRDNLGRDNGQRIHLKQIFLPGSGFEYWLKVQTKKIKTVVLINI